MLAYEILTCRNPRAACDGLWGFVLGAGPACGLHCRLNGAEPTRRAPFEQGFGVMRNDLVDARMSGHAFVEAAHKRLRWPDRGGYDQQAR